MDTLSALAPRQAGTLTREPAVEFDSFEQAAAAADRCPISCVCSGSTHNCVATGHSAFE
ncbi:hypothetical protein [Streptomyces iconiensis]|uniref:FxLD family lantipeptide n=1 Tax=Streptomyces iconiensis TaxID=1384038 RepID=A0ABT7AAL2_9ACTN|nr:hypothetical protein [Streptomyces iconiensis]MDJ1138394.1 hypothetical protein [Streptomyces iconiensis]